MKTKISLLAAGVFLTVLTDAVGQTTFTRITEGAIVNDLGRLFIRGVWGDFNNDGFLDVFVNDKAGTNVFYRNNGNGTFTKITQGDQVRGADNHSLPSWVDYDNDGNLDLLVPVGFRILPVWTRMVAPGVIMTTTAILICS